MAQHVRTLLEQLGARLSLMSANVRESVQQAIQAVLTVDPKLAASVIAADRGIDDEEVKIEKLAIDFLALHAPTAGDLRLVTVIIKSNSDLERIADCAVNVAQRVGPLSHLDGKYQPPRDLRLMADSVLDMLADAIAALNLTDEPAARRVLGADDVVDALYNQVVQDMLVGIEADGHNANRDLSNIMIAKNLERMGDLCMNIAEDVIFFHTGKIIRHSYGE